MYRKKQINPALLYSTNKNFHCFLNSYLQTNVVQAASTETKTSVIFILKMKMRSSCRSYCPSIGNSRRKTLRTLFPQKLRKYERTQILFSPLEIWKYLFCQNVSIFFNVLYQLNNCGCQNLHGKYTELRRRKKNTFFSETPINRGDSLWLMLSWRYNACKEQSTPFWPSNVTVPRDARWFVILLH